MHLVRMLTLTDAKGCYAARSIHLDWSLLGDGFLIKVLLRLHSNASFDVDHSFVEIELVFIGLKGGMSLDEVLLSFMLLSHLKSSIN